ncbi:MAG TPA: hypothetical protein VFT41_02860 [Gemmatimonadaceae bacterium]|nr:hypothetical protein [Gemmatimonadaceae bacterium]
MNAPLVVGTIMAVGSLAYVLQPLFVDDHPVCPACGPRPEDDAVYCSSCGRRLERGEGGDPE